MRCGTCGKDNPIRITRCQTCGDTISQRSRRAPASASGRDDGWSFSPTNSSGAEAYRYSLYGLIPLVGLVLGPMALLHGIRGLRLGRADSAARDTSQAMAGVLLGTFELLTNGIGLVLLVVGLISAF